MDNLELVKILIEKGKCLTEFPEISNYKSNLNLNVICIIHDAVICFSYLNPEMSEDDLQYDFYYSLAKKNNSEKIINMFESDRIELDSVYIFESENQPEIIQY